MLYDYFLRGTKSFHIDEYKHQSKFIDYYMLNTMVDFPYGIVNKP